MLRLDGSEVPVVVWSVPIDYEGESGGLVFVRDITLRRQAEEALRQSEQHYRNLANSGTILIWTTDLEGQCDYLNQPWLEFTGRKLEHELGEGWLKGIHPGDRRRFKAMYEGAFAQQEPFSLIYRLRRHDGVYRWVQTSGAPRFDTEGNLLGYIGKCFDINDQVTAQEQDSASEQGAARATRYEPSNNNQARSQYSY